MTAAVTGAVTAGFFLMSRIKEPATAYFNSRSKGSGQPTLADGSVKSFTATHDTYIQAGSVAGTVFGDEYLMQVRDEGAGPVAAGTSENVEDVGKAVAWLGDDDVAVHDDCFTPAKRTFRVPCSMKTSTYSRLRSTVSTTRKVRRLRGRASVRRHGLRAHPHPDGPGPPHHGSPLSPGMARRPVIPGTYPS
ncbi:hypothetical protein [Nonomuraea helvata]|uniref:Uncharacterized protein n=1 Tax=Nonomuraea helvata TaxID=37484 RepID=A0ABV5SAA9_9ACTN